ncbi:MAG TPA: glycosyltransferase family 2 protein [Petrimonas sp.]|uniref:Dodecaprenyl-phosphate galacturonate synthase n=1 Tax=bioreactor metagenome TaxID=1076179 RepID=A0A644YTK0_9ZZZZ|nr:glycosyltransferase family 2 protein [Petrimonas sp.]MEA4950170.1 glycosyltransferase family 2 protein [Petrimonas sp.]MEA4979710.1 glycosyltransferase family 2 protein [Petrimonas sp.]MEA5046856.1 glycosyltransferase family 2 protein [Petrimonas sp.]MEA5063392.1 glycosyltransferase family 2 protein [Petrimonas sp.]
MQTNENQTGQYAFTIIVPVYNEEDNLARLEEKLGKYLPQSLYKACVLFVNDGSTDDSGDRIHKMCGRHSDFFYIDMVKNGGLSVALKAGFDCCFSEYVGYMDADMQTDADDFNLLLPDLNRYEFVTGIRVNRKDSFFKNLQSKIANGYRRMMTGDGVSDTGCPLKVMRTEYAKRLPMFRGMHRFLPALILLQNGKVQQIPVRHYPRLAGKSKYHLWNRLTGPFIDCFAYRWMKKRYINYQLAASNLN